MRWRSTARFCAYSADEMIPPSSRRFRRSRSAYGSSAAAGIGGTATILCLPGSPGAAFLAFLALGRPLLRALHGWEQPVPALTARLAEPLETAPEEARLVAGVLCEGPAGPGFRRGGQGWPALGILAPAATGGGRDGRISVEPLPQE